MANPTFSLEQLHRRAAWDIKSHSQKWGNCSICRIGRLACRKVFIRGEVPCSLLLIGEAPGKTEDQLGKPFVGRAGKILNALMKEVINPEIPIPWSVTNLVACRPIDNPGEENRIPTKEEIENCSSRLNEIIDITTPQKILLLGKTAEEYWGLFKCRYPRIQTLAVFSPFYLLRKGGVKSSEFKLTTIEVNQWLYP